MGPEEKDGTRAGPTRAAESTVHGPRPAGPHGPQSRTDALAKQKRRSQAGCNS